MSHLGIFFRISRLDSGILLGELVRRMGYEGKQATRICDKILRFEETGAIDRLLLSRLATALGINEAMIGILRDIDEQDMLAAITDEPVDDWDSEEAGASSQEGATGASDQGRDELSAKEEESADAITELPDGSVIGHPLTFSIFQVLGRTRTLEQLNGTDEDAAEMGRWMRSVGWKVSDHRGQAAQSCNSLRGKVLATPPSRVAPFPRAVVAVLLHTSRGATGLLLNRVTRMDVLHTTKCLDRSQDRFLHSGGPVIGSTFMLHDCQDAGELAVGKGIWLAFNPAAEQLAMKEAARLRLYDGHVGWIAGDLELEVSRGLWKVVGDTTAADVFYDQFEGQKQWWDALHRYGHKLYDELGIVAAGDGSSSCEIV